MEGLQPVLPMLREVNSKDAKIAQLEAQQFNSALAASRQTSSGGAAA